MSELIGGLRTPPMPSPLPSPFDLLPCPPLFRGFYDRKKLFWKTIEDVTLVAACGPPGGGRQGVTPPPAAPLHTAQHAGAQ